MKTKQFQLNSKIIKNFIIAYAKPSSNLRTKQPKFKKSNLDCTHSITPTHVSSGGAHLRGLEPGQHSSEAAVSRWRHNVQVKIATLCRARTAR